MSSDLNKKKNPSNPQPKGEPVVAGSRSTPDAGAAQPPSAPKANGKIEVPVQEYEDLKKKVQELEGLREKFLHAAADFENAKKRNAREKEEFLKFSQERILKEILPVLDNFERALNHAMSVTAAGAAVETAQQHFNTLTAGVQRVQKQLVDILKMHGLTRMSVVGQPYDPHRHEVVGHVAEEGPEDRIVDELEAGYMFHDRLLRAAKVRVRVSPQAPSSNRDKQDEIT